MTNCVRLSDKDNVATTVSKIDAGGAIQIGGANPLSITARESIPLYHKTSIERIPRGSVVYKYGQPIGLAVEDIEAGTHVHTHNLVSETDYRGDR